MSKHSKWSKVKYQKAVTDVKKAQAYTKYARLITVAAREGGGDAGFNFKLRSAIDLALANNLPKDNIDRAVKRGLGDEDGGAIEEAIYEGYGPGGVGVIVEALTDNRNRTSASIKHIFATHGGAFGATGSVQWMFEHKAVVRGSVAKPLAGDQELLLIDAGAEDIVAEDDAVIVSGKPENLAMLRIAAEKVGLKVDEMQLEWIAKETVSISDGETAEKVRTLLEALDENDDVSAVFATVAL